jgi:hypothetical protein
MKMFSLDFIPEPVFVSKKCPENLKLQLDEFSELYLNEIVREPI